VDKYCDLNSFVDDEHIGVFQVDPMRSCLLGMVRHSLSFHSRQHGEGG
jgi:hypothetical protein